MLGVVRLLARADTSSHVAWSSSGYADSSERDPRNFVIACWIQHAANTYVSTEKYLSSSENQGLRGSTALSFPGRVLRCLDFGVQLHESFLGAYEFCRASAATDNITGGLTLADQVYSLIKRQTGTCDGTTDSKVANKRSSWDLVPRLYRDRVWLDR